jgi:acylphosphatase
MGERAVAAWRVEGRVQGVGFRYFVLQNARALGLVGWTANRADGAVEVHACGSPSVLLALEAVLRDGPPHSAVLRVTPVPPSEALEKKGTFTIEYDLA